MDLPTDSKAALTISLLEAVAGMISSSFIVFDILKNISKGQTISTKDKILLALSISNMASPIILSTSIVCDVFSCEFYPSVFRYMMVLYCMSSSSWLTACLSFFYYIKVMNFRSIYLSRLKNNIDSLIPWTILVVEVISLVGSLVNIIMISFRLADSSRNSHMTTNITEDISKAKDIYEAMYLSNFVLYPFMIATSMCIMASVLMHIHRMKRNVSTAGTINLEVHQRVVRTMLLLVAFYVVFYLLLILDYNMKFPGVWCDSTYQIILLTFSPVQSVILIHGNPRLKESWTQMWRCQGLKAPRT